MNRSTIVKRYKGCELGAIKTAEILTSSGVQGCELILAKLVLRGFKGVDRTCLKIAEFLIPGGLQGVDLIPTELILFMC